MSANGRPWSTAVCWFRLTRVNVTEKEFSRRAKTELAKFSSGSALAHLERSEGSWSRIASSALSRNDTKRNRPGATDWFGCHSRRTQQMRGIFQLLGRLWREDEQAVLL